MDSRKAVAERERERKKLSFLFTFVTFLRAKTDKIIGLNADRVYLSANSPSLLYTIGEK